MEPTLAVTTLFHHVIPIAKGRKKNGSRGTVGIAAKMPLLQLWPEGGNYVQALRPKIAAPCSCGLVSLRLPEISGSRFLTEVKNGRIYFPGGFVG